jgi:hypothetical protein
MFYRMLVAGTAAVIVALVAAPSANSGFTATARVPVSISVKGEASPVVKKPVAKPVKETPSLRLTPEPAKEDKDKKAKPTVKSTPTPTSSTSTTTPTPKEVPESPESHDPEERSSVMPTPTPEEGSSK